MADPLNILQIVQTPQRRGAEVFAYRLCRALELHGHRTGILYLYPYSGEAPVPLRGNDRVLGGAIEHPLEAWLGWHPGLLGELGRAIEQFGPDIVQINGARTLKYGSLARRRARGAGWALVYRNIGNPDDWLRGFRRRFFYRHLVMKQVDAIVAVSRQSQAALSRHYSPRCRTVVIPTGVEGNGTRSAAASDALRRSLDTPPGVPLILFAGNISHEKRPDRLLDVFGGVQQRCPDAHLWIAGEGPELGAVRRRVMAENLASRVRLLGPRDDLEECLRAADLLVLTSDTEGIPAVILEAAMAGLPVVATEVGGISECVRNGDTGVLVDREDVEGFVGQVVRLLGDAEARRRMGREARRWAQERFSMENVSGQYLELYESLLQ